MFETLAITLACSHLLTGSISYIIFSLNTHAQHRRIDVHPINSRNFANGLKIFYTPVGKQQEICRVVKQLSTKRFRIADQTNAEYDVTLSTEASLAANIRENTLPEGVAVLAAVDTTTDKLYIVRKIYANSFISAEDELLPWDGKGPFGISVKVEAATAQELNFTYLNEKLLYKTIEGGEESTTIFTSLPFKAMLGMSQDGNDFIASVNGQAFVENITNINGVTFIDEGNQVTIRGVISDASYVFVMSNDVSFTVNLTAEIENPERVHEIHYTGTTFTINGTTTPTLNFYTATGVSTAEAITSVNQRAPNAGVVEVGNSTMTVSEDGMIESPLFETRNDTFYVTVGTEYRNYLPYVLKFIKA